MIQAGEIVRRRADRPYMRVVEIRGGKALCEWTDRNGNRHEAEVALTDLVTMEESEPK